MLDIRNISVPAEKFPDQNYSIPQSLKSKRHGWVCVQLTSSELRCARGDSSDSGTE